MRPSRYFEKDSYYHFARNTLTPLLKDYSQWRDHRRDHPLYPRTTKHSIGGLYQAASFYCLGDYDGAAS